MFFLKMLGTLVPKRYHPHWKLRRLIETATIGVVLSGPFQGRDFNSFTSDNRPQDNFWLWMLSSQTHSLTAW
jgi:hypothetical protein